MPLVNNLYVEGVRVCAAVQLEEAMTQQLDDHIVMLQSMGFSPYKKPFEDRLAKWDTTLNLVSKQAMHAEQQGCTSVPTWWS